MVYLKVAYNGREFYGSQIQPDVRTVEGDIKKILSEEGINVTNFGFLSRTDRGVSALSNLLKLDTKEELNLRKMTHMLEDIWIYGKITCELELPLTKTYRYYLFDSGYDEKLIREGLSFFNGAHDSLLFQNIMDLKKQLGPLKLDSEKKVKSTFLNLRGKDSCGR
jgi:tRNA pseudouridine38-40 synthase